MPLQDVISRCEHSGHVHPHRGNTAGHASTPLSTGETCVHRLGMSPTLTSLYKAPHTLRLPARQQRTSYLIGG